ncbi:hypothetical protein EJ05DRAFT_503704 [Pseudovirgaria hyperparasitica]|uniref:Uncharacterized protein n=1 Tax=Pseudovirgaria hyperparasitica TaxID=470096 RepID=A0A6A6VVP5_9PEZI|nr:uncharacterized protein EJ05DRAFT_503704 [Pseudovirgaria hyperparasitica]KAF2754758.1 hypothetical protein EJ05DRAFT_503704 [Pseudovirgaria hyperparasitica]
MPAGFTSINKGVSRLPNSSTSPDAASPQSLMSDEVVSPVQDDESPSAQKAARMLVDKKNPTGQGVLGAASSRSDLCVSGSQSDSEESNESTFASSSHHESEVKVHDTDYKGPEPHLHSIQGSFEGLNPIDLSPSSAPADGRNATPNDIPDLDEESSPPASGATTISWTTPLSRQRSYQQPLTEANLMGLYRPSKCDSPEPSIEEELEWDTVRRQGGLEERLQGLRNETNTLRRSTPFLAPQYEYEMRDKSDFSEDHRTSPRSERPYPSDEDNLYTEGADTSRLQTTLNSNSYIGLDEQGQQPVFGGPRNMFSSNRMDTTSTIPQSALTHGLQANDEAFLANGARQTARRADMMSTSHWQRPSLLPQLHGLPDVAQQSRQGRPNSVNAPNSLDIRRHEDVAILPNHYARDLADTANSLRREWNSDELPSVALAHFHLSRVYLADAEWGLEQRMKEEPNSGRGTKRRHSEIRGEEEAEEDEDSLVGEDSRRKKSYRK